MSTQVVDPGRQGLSAVSRSGRWRPGFCLIAGIAVTAGCAADEAPVDPATCGATELYRIDRVQLPANNAETRTLARDLNRDGTPDNQLGMVTSTLQTQFGIDFSATAAARLGQDVTWNLGLRRCPGGEVLVALTGDGSADELQTIGEEIDGVIIATGADTAVPLSTFFDPLGTYPEAGWLRGLRSHLELRVSADGSRADAIVAMGLESDAVLDAAARPMTPFLDGYDQPSPSLEHFDPDGDGVITLEEVKAASFTRAVLAGDLRIDGTLATSIGFGISATR